MKEIMALGEVLIDMTQSGTDKLGNGQFTAYPGGAPANVAVAVSRLGGEAGFIGKVGNDAFGKGLADVLRKEDVDVSGLYYCEEIPTTMALVSVADNGERDFAFYRTPGADTQLTAQEALKALEGATAPKILHVGSLSLTDEPSASACESAIQQAIARGTMISYDPNYRAALWDSEERATDSMKSLLPYADILKVSDEEMPMLTGTEDLEEGSRILSGYGAALVMVTLGDKGVFARRGEYTVLIPGIKVDVADTNGAGDTFLGAMLAQIAAKDCRPDGIGDKELEDMLNYANRAAALTCSRPGAIPAMPYASELE